MRNLPWLGRALTRLRRRWWEEPRIDRAYAARPHHEPATPRLASAPPRISMVMPVHETRAEWLRAAISSVLAQTLPCVDLCVADDASQASHVGDILSAAAAADARVRVMRLPERRGIAGATHAAAELATGDYVAFMDHDDLLAPQALGVMAAAAVAHPGAGLLFSDEDQLVGGQLRAPYFKPGWNPDLLMQQNLVCHLAMCRREVWAALGGMRAGFEGAQDHDFALRAWAMLGDAGVRHVPGILYHWRQDPGSFSAAAAARCREASRRAVAEHLGAGAVLEDDPALPGWMPVRFDPGDELGRAAVLRPGDADGKGAYLVFLSPALRPAPGAVAALVGHLLRPGVGCVGGRIEDARGRLRHGGWELDAARGAVAVRGAAGDPGYRGRFRLARTVSAVSGECLAVRREVFRAAGGWRAEAGDFADVDLCLRVAEMGLRTVWTPAARFVGPVRGREPMPRRRGDRQARDPYVNPYLAALSGRLSLTSLGSGARGLSEVEERRAKAR